MITIIARHVSSGFEVHVSGIAIEQLDGTIADLLARGLRPTSSGADVWQKTPDGLPICSRHAVPMRERQKQGDTRFSHQVLDPGTKELVWCRGYPGPSSPGWSILTGS